MNIFAHLYILRRKRRGIEPQEIETWLSYLDGKQVDEATSYRQSYKNKKRKLAELTKSLVECCKADEDCTPRMPGSLKLARAEFQRFQTTCKSD